MAEFLAAKVGTVLRRLSCNVEDHTPSTPFWGSHSCYKFMKSGEEHN